MRFKIDENLPAESSVLFTRSGHDAVTVIDQRMGGTIDPLLLKICAAESRSLITLDLDFADIRAYPPEEYSGVVVLRPESQAKPRVLDLLRQMIERLSVEPLAGKLWIVDETGIRIRE